MLVDLVAHVAKPHRVELVQHGGGAVRVPPVAGKLSEALRLVGEDAGLDHATLHAFSTCKGEASDALEPRWTIFSSGTASSIARTCRSPRLRRTSPPRSTSIRPRR